MNVIFGKNLFIDNENATNLTRTINFLTFVLRGVDSVLTCVIYNDSKLIQRNPSIVSFVKHLTSK